MAGSPDENRKQRKLLNKYMLRRKPNEWQQRRGLCSPYKCRACATWDTLVKALDQEEGPWTVEQPLPPLNLASALIAPSFPNNPATLVAPHPLALENGPLLDALLQWHETNNPPVGPKLAADPPPWPPQIAPLPPPLNPLRLHPPLSHQEICLVHYHPIAVTGSPSLPPPAPVVPPKGHLCLSPQKNPTPDQSHPPQTPKLPLPRALPPPPPLLQKLSLPLPLPHLYPSPPSLRTKLEPRLRDVLRSFGVVMNLMQSFQIYRSCRYQRTYTPL
mmetsp:Transcript_34021/g.55110  ORF Transcript_34021/g.55110 Transcript_34021/m.55110 type:complete len:273 (+) Transcript_34021:1534-2352(+)